MDSYRSLVNYAASKIKDEDIIHRAFLKPFQIALKTSRTQFGNKHKFSPTSLPSGLKIAVKESILNNKYDLMNIECIDDTTRWGGIKSLSQDNFLSLIKRPQGIQLAICICMYSEDVKMLKQTLAGVSQNISNIVMREGISSDKIGVFVIMDGVEKIDSTVVNYFEELQRRNNINLGANIAPTLTVEQMIRRSDMSSEQINEEELSNVNNFLFDVAELNDRNQRRFFNVYNEFDEIKKLQHNINHLKKGGVKLDELPIKLKPFLINELRDLYQKEYSISQLQIKSFSEQKLLFEYENDSSKLKPILVKVLTQGERHCQEYLKSREDLAYLAYFRNKISNESNDVDRFDVYKQSEENQLNQTKSPMTMNLFLCVKYKNTGKLSSHNWFINGFCKQLKPRYSVLLDVGLRPQSQALLKMYRYMKRYPKVGGVCGYMSLKIEMLEEKDEMQQQEIDLLTAISMKFADIQRTQQVQYHFAHLLDKPFESAFNFIHVLPGAFSAYNMKAIVDYDKDDDDLLKSYFKSIEDKIKTTQIRHTNLSLSSIIMRTFLPDMVNSCCVDIHPQSDEQMLYNQNIYLAQDRILCMGIFKKGYELAYLPDAYAHVDPIKSLHTLLGQRKRWINGSFFAFQKVKRQLSEHQRQKGCEFLLHLQLIYLTLMNALLYFAPSFFLFTVHIAMEAFRDDVLVNVLKGTVQNPNQSQFYNAFVYTMDFIYVVLMLSIVFFSLHLKSTSKKFKSFIYGVSTVLGIFAISVFIVLLVDVLRGLIDESAFLVKNQAYVVNIPGGMTVINSLRWILVGSLAMYILPIGTYLLLFGKFHILMQIILGAFSILFYGPTYLNILYMYSLCRIDDISWGTKGLDSDKQSSNEKLTSSWKILKYIQVSKYVGWNIIVSVILLSFGSSYTPRIFITITIVAIMGLSQSIKILLGIFYMIKYKLSTCCCQKTQLQQRPQPSRISEIIDLYKDAIMQEIIEHLMEMEEEYSMGKQYKIPGGSFIQMSRSKRIVEKCFQKKKNDFDGRSEIIKKVREIEKYKGKLPTIEEQKSSMIQKSYNTPIKERNMLNQQSREELSSSGSLNQLSPSKLLPNKPQNK